MKSTALHTQRNAERLRYVFLAPIPFFLVAVFLLAYARLDFIFNPPFIVPLLNIIFLTIVTLLVALLAARSYLDDHSGALLFMGCGALMLGLSAVLAGISAGRYGANWMVTIFNTGALFSAAFHLTSASGNLLSRGWKIRRGWGLLVAMYAAVIVVVYALAVLVVNGYFPVFFVEGKGATLWDKSVLWSAAFMFALSALLMSVGYGREKTRFVTWYVRGLVLIAIGLAGVSLETRIGDLLNWAGRLSQYLGCAYLLTAVFSAIDHGGVWKIELEASLREMSDRYHALVETSPEAIFVNRANKIVFVNQSAVRLFGASGPDQLLGRSPYEMFDQSYHQVMAERIGELMQGKTVPMIEGKVRRLDGEVIDAEITASPFVERGERAIQVLIRDITRRKRAEEKLKSLTTNLEAQVARKSKELLRAHIALERSRRMADIGRLASTMAHEMRNPLATIHTAAYNIKKKAGNPVLDPHISTINKKVLESDLIIQNLLNFSRVRTAHHEPVKLLDLLKECMAAISGKYADWNVLLSKRISRDVDDTVEADPAQLRIFFNNILDNAYQALADKKGSVFVSAQLYEGGEWVIEVTDSGTGIDKEHLNKMFIPFFTTKSRGTGLGLAVCREIIELHGGTISVASEKGKGTTFTATLPVHPPAYKESQLLENPVNS